MQFKSPPSSEPELLWML